jgi:hypothetical protein
VGGVVVMLFDLLADLGCGQALGHKILLRRFQHCAETR